MNLNKLLEELRELVPDRFPREKLDEYEQGVIAGKLAIIDYIEKIIKNERN